LPLPARLTAELDELGIRAQQLGTLDAKGASSYPTLSTAASHR